MDQLVERLTHGDNLFLTLGSVVGITAIVFGAVRSMVRSTAREKTRREIAAYIAEGSMTPEQGEKLMGAGERRSGCN